ncbi:MAG: hypothetical protein ABII06_00195, partial [Pseudomonadota bacterium]
MQKKRREKPAKNRTGLRTLLLLLIVFCLAGWWLWTTLHDAPPRLNYILVNKNGEPLKILKGEILRLHPKDQLQIVDISTNLPLNIGVRLVARGMDVTALLYERFPLSSLLPSNDLLKDYRFRVQVKHYNRDLGHFDLLVEPFSEDWLDKADRIIDPARRADILE